ncbi:MAG TPA: hypothetical protein VEM93_05490, partial [Actinomycetota bacterium]|nr:hypothetical protein [Actinomycetota bacterium]
MALRMAARDPIDLIICDDHRMLTDLLIQVVGQDPGLHLLVPPVQSPEEAIRLCDQAHPDVV